MEFIQITVHNLLAVRRFFNCEVTIEYGKFAKIGTTLGSYKYCDLYSYAVKNSFGEIEIIRV